MEYSDPLPPQIGPQPGFQLSVVFKVLMSSIILYSQKVIPGCHNLTGYWAPGHGILVHTSDGRPSKMPILMTCSI